jgi:hypothetical protein
MRREAGSRGTESGFALAALLVTIAVMMVGMSVAAPTWRYVVQNDKEQELIFRGNQIADAIQRYQAKNGNAVPASLEVLVKGKYLRKLYTDPMTKDGEWRLIHQGEAMVPGARPQQAGIGAGARRRREQQRQERQAQRRRSRFGTKQVLGGIVGVASKSEEEGLRLYNGRSKYSDWIFGPGQPRVVGGRPITPVLTKPGSQPGARPGVTRPGRRTPGRGRQPRQSGRPGARRP